MSATNSNDDDDHRTVTILDEEALACPRCLGPYLHHTEVLVFDRREDAERTTVTSVLGGRIASHSAVSDGCGNPSSRRNGIAVAFWCETCDHAADPDARVWLEIAQHKGLTLVCWRIPEDRS